MPYGRLTLGSVGTNVQVTADGRPLAKIGGITVDWTTITAVSGADVTLNDGVIVPIGQKYLRYGQVMAVITASGLYGPYDPAASDGRQTLARGSCFILNRTALAIEPSDDYPEAIYGGAVFLARIIQSGTGTHTLAAGPTLAELLAAFPQLHPVTGN